MKKLNHLKTAILVLLLASMTVGGLVFDRNTHVAAQEEFTPTPTMTSIVPVETPVLDPTETLTLEDLPVQVSTNGLLAQEASLSSLNIDNLTLISPLGLGRFSFQVPSNWEMAGESILYLNLEYFENTGEDVESFADLLSILDVRVDGTLIASINLTTTDVGSPKTIPIPLSAALLNQSSDQEHEVQLLLRAVDYCYLNSEARVLVRSDLSYLHLEFNETTPSLDLAQYPAPIYFGTLGEASQELFVVIPDNPSAIDQEVLGWFSAGIGMLAYNDINLELRTPSTITEAELSDNNIVVLGTIEGNQLIKELYEAGSLPTTLDENGQITANDLVVEEDDGLIQIAVNPNNPARTIAIVSGTTELGLKKAVRTLTRRPSPFAPGGEVNIISAISPQPEDDSSADADLTFAELGLNEITLSGLGASSVDISFIVPYDERLTSDSYIELLYRFSEILAGNGQTTVLGVTLNRGAPLLSTYLDKPSDDVRGATRTLRIDLPENNILPGTLNTVNILLAAQTDWDCNPPDEDLAWFVLENLSRLHLPTVKLPTELISPQVRFFPAPFNSVGDMSNVLIMMPDEPTMAELQQMAKLLSLIGSNIQGGSDFQPLIANGIVPDGVDLSQYNIIVIGRPSTNAFLKGLNGALPQPFAEDSDALVQIVDDVVYRSESNVDVGIIETLPSLWSAQRVVLVFSGTSQRGQDEALNSIIEQLVGQSELRGNVVFVSQGEVTALETSDIDEQTDILTAIAEVATESVLSGTRPPEIGQSFTVTPGPTETATTTPTTGPTETPSPIFSLEPSPVSPTPLPTFPALSEDDIQPESLELPSWIGILILLVVVIVLSVAVYLLFRQYGPKGSKEE